MSRDGVATALRRRLLWTATFSRFAGAAELVVLNWWILTATGSAMMVGVLTAARLVPLVVSAPVAGALADRQHPVRMLTWIYASSAVATVVVVAVIAVSGHAAHQSLWAWIVVAVIAVRSLITSPEAVIRQLAIAALTDGTPTGMARGMADLSTVLTLCLVLGPAASGVLLAVRGPILAMILVVACHAVALVGGVWIVRAYPSTDPCRPTPSATFNRWSVVAEVFRRDRQLLRQVLLAAGPMFAIFPYTAMVPVIFDDRLFANAGVGAAIGSVCAAGGAVAATLGMRQWSVHNPSRWAWVSATTVSVPLVAVALALSGEQVVLAFMAFILVGAVGQIYRTMNRTAVMVRTPDEVRGAVLGVASEDRVLIPLGTMVCGLLAATLGAVGMLLCMAAGNIVLILAMVLGTKNRTSSGR